MKRFRQLIRENAIIVPERKDTMDIDRKDMPQIETKDLKHFFNYLKKNNVESIQKTVDPKILKATQGHFHKEKINIHSREKRVLGTNTREDPQLHIDKRMDLEKANHY